LLKHRLTDKKAPKAWMSGYHQIMLTDAST